MKHLAQIQKEFVKQAKWTDLSDWVQRRYLKKHPHSEKHLEPKRAPKRLMYKGHPFISVDTVIDVLNSVTDKMVGGPITLPTEEEMKMVDPTIYGRNETEFLK